MSHVKNRDTKPEMLLRSLLHKNGYRYRLHKKDLPGSPDIVLPKYKSIIFVNGCFWHGHKNCRASRLPSTNKNYWENKIQENRKRDSKVNRELIQLGWKVITVWQCQIKTKPKLEKQFNKLMMELIN